MCDRVGHQSLNMIQEIVVVLGICRCPTYKYETGPEGPRLVPLKFCPKKTVAFGRPSLLRNAGVRCLAPASCLPCGSSRKWPHSHCTYSDSLLVCIKCNSCITDVSKTFVFKLKDKWKRRSRSHSLANAPLNCVLSFSSESCCLVWFPCLTPSISQSVHPNITMLSQLAVCLCWANSLPLSLHHT